MAAIEVDRLTKTYGDVTAVDELSFAVDNGEIFGFLGPNGAGKSTTLNIMLGFVSPTAGDVSVLGMDPGPQGKAIRRRIGVLPEGYHTYDRLTGRQHLEFAIESKRVDDDPDAILERVGLDAVDADRATGGYSKGMAQRLALGMGLVGEPDVLVLDEPTTGLDPLGAREIRTIVQEENARGATVFFSSHILEQVEAVCDRVGIIYQGRMAAVDTVDGLRDSVTAVSTLEVQLEGLSDAVLEAVRAIPEVQDVGLTRRAGSDRLVVESEGAKIDVLLAIVEAGGEVKDFRTQEASLEDVFHAYTVAGPTEGST